MPEYQDFDVMLQNPDLKFTYWQTDHDSRYPGQTGFHKCLIEYHGAVAELTGSTPWSLREIAVRLWNNWLFMEDCGDDAFGGKFPGPWAKKDKEAIKASLAAKVAKYREEQSGTSS